MLSNNRHQTDTKKLLEHFLVSLKNKFDHSKMPIVDKKNPSDAQIEEFLKVANDPATGKFYVHCAGGRHRTGVIGAIYRFNHDHWNYDQAYAEMKQFDFYTSNGHGKQLDFVQDYWQQFQAKRQANADVSATGKRHTNLTKPCFERRAAQNERPFFLLTLR